jgi:hypothetical protein
VFIIGIELMAFMVWSSIESGADGSRLIAETAASSAREWAFRLP